VEPLINKITQELAAIGLGPIVLSKYPELKNTPTAKEHQPVSRSKLSSLQRKNSEAADHPFV
jgi:hypothetical protein